MGHTQTFAPEAASAAPEAASAAPEAASSFIRILSLLGGFILRYFRPSRMLCNNPMTCTPRTEESHHNKYRGICLSPLAKFAGSGRR